jgi:hypothetical protein
MIGDFVGGEQCDHCGNSTYRVELWRDRSYRAVCAIDPDDDPEFRHPEPCGTGWPILVWHEDEVVF